MHNRLTRIRRIETALSIGAALLAATAAIDSRQATAAWIATITTIMASVAAHGAAARYEFQQIEFVRTADELERLRASHGTVNPDELIEECERIISIQN